MCAFSRLISRPDDHLSIYQNQPKKKRNTHDKLTTDSIRTGQFDWPIRFPYHSIEWQLNRSILFTHFRKKVLIHRNDLTLQPCIPNLHSPYSELSSEYFFFFFETNIVKRQNRWLQKIIDDLSDLFWVLIRTVESKIYDQRNV